MMQQLNDLVALFVLAPFLAVVGGVLGGVAGMAVGTEMTANALAAAGFVAGSMVGCSCQLLFRLRRLEWLLEVQKAAPEPAAAPVPVPPPPPAVRPVRKPAVTLSDPK